jgi:hypothetical protein
MRAGLAVSGYGELGRFFKTLGDIETLMLI